MDNKKSANSFVNISKVESIDLESHENNVNVLSHMEIPEVKSKISINNSIKQNENSINKNKENQSNSMFEKINIDSPNLGVNYKIVYNKEESLNLSVNEVKKIDPDNQKLNNDVKSILFG